MSATAPLQGDDLYKALETPSSFTLWRLGGAGIAIRTPNSLLYVDPFLAESGGPGWVRQTPRVIDRLPPADLILGTHEHADHTDTNVLKPQLEGSNCLFASAEPSIEIAREVGFPDNRLRTLNVGDTFQHANFTITALDVRDDDPGSPPKRPLAYVIRDEDSGITVYHGGDAMMSPFFTQAGEAHRIDVACLSVGTTVNGAQYYLAPEESISAAKMLRARVFIPLHWDLWQINGLPASVWQPLQAVTTTPKVLIVPPGGCWQPGNGQK